METMRNCLLIASLWELMNLLFKNNFKNYFKKLFIDPRYIRLDSSCRLHHTGVFYLKLNNMNLALYYSYVHTVHWIQRVAAKLLLLSTNFTNIARSEEDCFWNLWIQIPPRENWFRYARRVYATAINFSMHYNLSINNLF